MDGLLWEPVIYHTDAVEQQLQEQHICYQIFNGAIPDWYHDQFCQLGQIMTQQLVDLSHRTIAFVTQPAALFLRLCVWAMSSVCIKTGSLTIPT